MLPFIFAQSIEVVVVVVADAVVACEKEVWEYKTENWVKNIFLKTLVYYPATRYVMALISVRYTVVVAVR